jgi:inner membrane transporter RhtA
VLLFAHLMPPGVAWLRIASAGLVFALWRRPWRQLAALLPATATAIGFLVLRQVPTIAELLGIALVIGGVALHQAKA